MIEQRPTRLQNLQQLLGVSVPQVADALAPHQRETPTFEVPVVRRLCGVLVVAPLLLLQQITHRRVHRLAPTVE